MTSDSLLGHLAWRFPGATEDIATEALQYILSKQEGARKALADLLSSGGAIPQPMDSFDTQQVFEGTMKPDLVAFNKKREVLLVESKFWASLTPNQPNGYLRLMMDKLPNARNLLFVAPEARQDDLWEELRELAGKEFKVEDKPGASGVRSAIVSRSAVEDNRGHRLMLTSWDALLNRMKDSMERSGADEDRDLQQLRGLCALACDGPPLLNGDAGDLSVVDDYKALLADAVALTASRGIISTEGLSYGARSAGHGRYFHFVNAAGEKFTTAYAWVGFNFARTGSPFFLWFIADSGTKRESLARLEEVHAKVPEELDQHGHISIPISATAGYASVREELVGKLKKIRDRITMPEQGESNESA